jgi:hypothetical protein
MSALGQKQTFAAQKGMSALPPKADIGAAQINVRYGPIADIAETASNTIAYGLVGKPLLQEIYNSVDFVCFDCR